MYTSILHGSYIVSNLEDALHFYVNILELIVDESRPDLGYPGAWLNVTDSQQIHLLNLPNPDPVTGRPQHGGRDRHIAIGVSNFEKLIQNLETNNIAYTLSKSGRQALFCRDPDGNALEFIKN